MTNEELALKIKQGYNEYIDELWQNTYRLVYKLAMLYLTPNYKRLQSNGLTVDDVLQESYFGFLQAIEYYDPEKPYKFNSYLNYNIENTVNRMFKQKITVESLESEIKGAEKLTLLDIIPDTSVETDFDNAEFSAMADDLMQALNSALTEQERICLIDEFYLNKPKAETAKALHIESKERTELRRKALKKLRKKPDIRRKYSALFEVEAYKHTGLNSYKERQASSIELAFEKFYKG